MSAILWFDDSPDAGDPACICSACNEVIPETEIVIRLRMLNWDGDKEARFHLECWEAAQVELFPEALMTTFNSFSPAISLVRDLRGTHSILVTSEEQMHHLERNGIRVSNRGNSGDRWTFDIPRSQEAKAKQLLGQD